MSSAFHSLILAAFCLSLFEAHAEEVKKIKYEELSIEQLMEVNISTVTKKEQSVRRAPGITTIITDKDIRNMGARDLIDILRTVPGFNFAYDTSGVVSLGVRGLWAEEGKHLVIIDGIEMNELQYSSFGYGNEIPVDQIKRIEIIRGPGSAVYGGFAELAVINITTKSGADLKGATVQATAGQWQNATARTNLSMAAGNKISGGDYSLSVYAGRALRGDGRYYGQGEAPANNVTYTGDIDFEDADQIKPLSTNFGLNKKGYKFRFLYNRYELDSYTFYGMTSSQGTRGIPVLFESYNLATSYEARITEHTAITPQLQIFRQRPWESTGEHATFNFGRLDVMSTRIRPSLTLKSDVSESLNVLAGVEHNADQHKIDSLAFWDTGVLVPTTFLNGTNERNMSSTAAYLQTLYNTGSFDVTAGARYEKPSETKESFVPRLGLTKSEQAWHAKLLYSQAFRSPVMANFEYKLNDEILPEQLETYEAEWGHTIGSKSYFTANIFHTVIKDPIVYQYNGAEAYDNSDAMGSDGIELNYLFKPTWGQLQLAYAYYQRTTANAPDLEVPGKKQQFLGMPQHSVLLNSTFFIAKKRWKVNTQVQYYSEKSGYNFNGAAMAIKAYEPVLLFNLYLSRENIFTKGLGAGIGVFNLLDQQDHYIQAYNGGSSPIPAPSRELMIRIDYSFL